MDRTGIVLVKTGDTFPDIRETLQDFEHWIIRGLGVDPRQIDVVNAPALDPLPGGAVIAGVVIAGSHAMVTQNLDWSLRVEAWLAPVVGAGTPVLGICYGHQLLAKAMGGLVDFHPQGLEIGTAAIHLTHAATADPLFHDLPAVITVHTCHSQTVLRLPEGAVCLAENSHDPHHAFRLGRAAWGVQFHPEYSRAVMAGYIDNMVPVIEALGKDADQLRRSVSDTPEALKILERFAGLCLA
ncbi:MAG: glutamine amidotransferase [Desulfotignum sp.]